MLKVKVMAGADYNSVEYHICWLTAKIDCQHGIHRNIALLKAKASCKTRSRHFLTFYPFNLTGKKFK